MRMRRLTAGLIGIAAGVVSAAGADAPIWERGQGYRSAPLPEVSKAPAGFTAMNPAATGIQFTNALSQARHLTNQIFLNGSGVALGDIDGDGWCDVYLCALDGPNRLYRNLGGWKFEDITEASGVGMAALTATGAAMADIDGDGDLDLVVNTVGQGTHLYFNGGSGEFRRVTHEAGLNVGRAGMSMALADTDGDGDLDLYITNYRTSALMDMPQTHFQFGKVEGQTVVARVNGRPVSEPDLAYRYRVNAAGGVEELGEPDVFYRNEGGTNYARVSFTEGAFLDEAGKPLTFPPLDWGLSAAFRDLNDDGHEDLYICNDFDSEDRIWLNRGDGTFRLAPRLTLRKTSMFSMGLDFADIDGDGREDIFVLDMLSREQPIRVDTQMSKDWYIAVAGEIDARPGYMMNTLLRNRGDGTYAEMAQLAGVAASDWSWAALFLDVDLDGWEDLLISNGHERAARSLDMAARMKAMRTNRELTPAQILDLRRLYPRLAAPNAAFRNRGDLTFEDAGKAWGFDVVGVSHGMAMADLDNDGDLDVAINNLNDPAGVFRNNAGAPRLAVRLKGRAPNTQGIGAVIRVTGGTRTQMRRVMSGGRYLSGDDPLKSFAAVAESMTIDVRWPGGGRSSVEGARAGRIYEIDAAGAVPGSAPVSVVSKPLFEEASQRLGHAHHETMFNDHERQFLLPNRLSQLGPGVAWFDLDGDGREDILVGSGRGGRLAAYRNRGDGGFEALTGAPYDQAVTRDQTGLIAYRTVAGDAMVLAGSSNYEDGLALGASVRVYEVGAGRVTDRMPGQESAVGPLAMADWDGDGDLDLFVGGRSRAGRYPEPAVSAVYAGEGGQWRATVDEAIARTGMVSGAVFSDLDGDGDPELALACDWGPIRILDYRDGAWRDRTEAWGLKRFTGWWNGVAAGDFDGDGRMDLAASNWGRNTPYEGWRRDGLRVYYGDMDGNGTWEVVECHWDEALKKEVPNLPLEYLAGGLPALGQRFSSHLAYGRSSAREILKDMADPARMLRVDWLESTVFLNRGGTFEARPLPTEAQMAPAFGVTVADVDGDGHEDLAMTQNLFGVFPLTPRYDAGRGLVMVGDGRGNFRALSGDESGVVMYGEQRGCAAADYDGDGRVDLLIGQNGRETKLYRNVRGRPGIRVRLEGPPDNRHAAGAMVRLVYGADFGPAREWHLGHGYWSQNGAVQVLGGEAEPTAVWVRFPGEEGKTWAWLQGARDVVISHAQGVRLAPKN